VNTQLDITPIPGHPMPGRRGVALLIVMICLLLVTMIGGVLLKLSVTQYRQVRRYEQRVQAEWLARSGLGRARVRLQADPGYAGETWTVTEQTLPGGSRAVVRIAVRRLDEDPDARLVTATADCPDDPIHRARVVLTRSVPTKTNRNPDSRLEN